MTPQSFRPPKKAGAVSLWFAFGAVFLTALLGYYVKNDRAEPVRRFRGYRPNYKVQVHLVKTGVGAHPADRSIAAAAWAEFDVKTDPPVPAAAISLQIRAKDLFGDRYATNGFWKGNHFIAYLRPGFKPPKEKITMIVSRGGLDLAMVTLPKTAPPHHYFDPKPVPPKTPGVKISFYRTSIPGQPVGVHVDAPLGPHDLVAVGWGGSSYAPHNFDSYYTIVGPEQYLNTVDPITQERSTGPALVPVAFDYPELAKAVRLKVLVLRAKPQKRLLRFTLPDVKVVDGQIRFAENAMRDPENPFLMIITREIIALDDKGVNTEFYLQNWSNGVEPLVEASSLKLLSPASILGHTVAVQNGTWVGKPPATATMEGAKGEFDPRSSSSPGELRVELDQWAYSKLSEEEVVLPFDFRTLPTSDQRINPPSVLKFTEPDQAQMVTFSYSPFGPFRGSRMMGSPRPR